MLLVGYGVCGEEWLECWSCTKLLMHQIGPSKPPPFLMGHFGGRRKETSASHKEAGF